MVQKTKLQGSGLPFETDCATNSNPLGNNRISLKSTVYFVLNGLPP